jgi:putative phage-type endonuclease
MSRIIEVKQGTPEWAAHRARHLNASDAAAMLGISSHKTRGQLLREMASGLSPDVDAHTQERFDQGHELEAQALPVAEEMIMDALYPMVLSDDIDGLPLSASFDGLTGDMSTSWENKTGNTRLMDSLSRGIIPAEYHPQMEQGLLLSGAQQCLFTASNGSTEDGTFIMRDAFYLPNRELRERLLAGWKQFRVDLAGYKHGSEGLSSPVVGRAPVGLPALLIQVVGSVTRSNLPEFRDHAIALFRRINTDLQTDADFLDAEEAVKFCKDIEGRLAAAKQHALSQTASIDDLFRAVDGISAEARCKRLELEKLVKIRKDSRRLEIMDKARTALTLHVAGINDTMPIKIVGTPAFHLDLQAAIKGLRTIQSVQDACDQALANAKIATSQIAERVRVNCAVLDEFLTYATLIPDRERLALEKSPDDLRNLIEARIRQHVEAERLRAETERLRLESETLKRKRAEEEALALAAEAKTEAEARALPPALEQPVCVPRHVPPPVVLAAEVFALDVEARNLHRDAMALSRLYERVLSPVRDSQIIAEEDFQQPLKVVFSAAGVAIGLLQEQARVTVHATGALAKIYEGEGAGRLTEGEMITTETMNELAPTAGTCADCGGTGMYFISR